MELCADGGTGGMFWMWVIELIGSPAEAQRHQGTCIPSQ